MAWLFSKALMDSVNSPSLQEPAEESSAANSLDGAQSALWSGKHTQQASWLPAKMTDACRLSRSGMTFRPLTDDLGEAALMSFLEDFPARTSAQQERELELTESGAVCGDTWRELSVRFDRNTSSWKTHLCLWDEDLPESSVTLPKWGMMRSGVLWERTTLPPLTSGTESGSWPTPVSSDHKNRGPNSKQQGLSEWVRKWPTPTVDDAHNVTRKSGQFQSLTRRVMFPTPQANEDAAGTPKGKMQRMLGNCEEVRGKTEAEWKQGSLNPDWVEWLMGWPLFWTTLDVAAKPYYDAWYETQQRTQTGPEEIQGGIVRNVWWDIDPAETPQRRQPVQQPSKKCDDCLPSVPHKDTLLNRELGQGKCETSAMQDMRGDIQTQEVEEVEAMWQAGLPERKRKVISRVAMGVEARVDRLKAIGNGQVPAVAALAWRILSEKK